MKAGSLEVGPIRGCANIASFRQAKKCYLPLRLSTYYLIMVRCLRVHVSMIEITTAQLTAYQMHGIDPTGHALCSIDGGCRRCRRFLLLQRQWCRTYLASGSYFLLSLRLGVFRRCRCCLIRCFCHVEMSCRCILLACSNVEWKRSPEAPPRPGFWFRDALTRGGDDVYLTRPSTSIHRSCAM